MSSVVLQEEWKRAVSSRYPDHVADLEISNTGKIRKVLTHREYKTSTDDDGHVVIKRHSKRIKVAVLVAETFIQKRPEGHVVRHTDGNKLNNNRNNLEFITTEENSVRVPVRPDDGSKDILTRLSNIERMLQVLLDR